jgi:hypothetical protein
LHLMLIPFLRFTRAWADVKWYICALILAFTFRPAPALLVPHIASLALPIQRSFFKSLLILHRRAYGAGSILRSLQTDRAQLEHALTGSLALVTLATKYKPFRNTCHCERIRPHPNTYRLHCSNVYPTAALAFRVPNGWHRLRQDNRDTRRACSVPQGCCANQIRDRLIP